MMKRFLRPGLVFVAGAMCLPSAISPPRTAHPPAPDYSGDPRLSRLRQFFADSACPAAEYAETFLEASDDNSLDWRLLPSISYIETTGGKAAPGNNYFGWDSGHARFPTPAAAIHAVAYQLTHTDAYSRRTLEGKLRLYNAAPEYPGSVLSVMRRLGRPGITESGHASTAASR